ncbi:Cytokinin riboside 5'-monophosphate phosphoribohydrolase [Fundidesulfovibrio magnetotacticus]|uniref:Cytokinin riboside 5'-monophosphate phosphoribohydrolase n=1 Tax=Fundidesulfovibrio magnetotacticus TaxID=2730080 RepID=A0A6V8M224_9BACT|nr:TIGR00725 family protein [Fundidesulfovibrio magnetotacticus]GFK94505.1 Cytokinin riboside 5'-monophosphate phosphoribohydrolase [Fundidesulfovibrio magnetotacticus]
MKKRISVIGAGECGPDVEAVAHRLGTLIAQNGFDLLCGGRMGVQRAACRGAKEAGGFTIGLLPGLDFTQANEFVDVPVVTGLGHMRNFLVVKNGAAAVAVEGGAGTLSEIGLAMKSGIPVVAIGRWSGVDGVRAARDADEAMDIVLSLVGR